MTDFDDMWTITHPATDTGRLELRLLGADDEAEAVRTATILSSAHGWAMVSNWLTEVAWYADGQLYHGPKEDLFAATRGAVSHD